MVGLSSAAEWESSWTGLGAKSINELLLHPIEVFALLIAVLFIRSTVAVMFPKFQTRSRKVNRKEPLPVKIWFKTLHQAMGSENHVSVAITSLSVVHVILYTTKAVGGVLSIQKTFAIALPVLP